MINVHIYGFLAKKFDLNAKLSVPTVVKLEHLPNESFNGLLHRLNINYDELGDCFINGIVVLNGDTKIPDNARVGVFGLGMLLHEGGQYLKYRSVYETKMEE